jgi:hypothetical protein
MSDDAKDEQAASAPSGDGFTPAPPPPALSDEEAAAAEATASMGGDTILPDGTVAGHTSMLRYYRQTFRAPESRRALVLAMREQRTRAFGGDRAAALAIEDGERDGSLRVASDGSLALRGPRGASLVPAFAQQSADTRRARRAELRYRIEREVAEGLHQNKFNKRDTQPQVMNCG